MHKIIKIKNLDCAACAAELSEELNGLDGIFGAEAGGGSPLWKTDMRGPVCLGIGSEGAGISRLVRETCDLIVDIPLLGKVNSLNASAAAAVLMYEIVRQRHE